MKRFFLTTKAQTINYKHTRRSLSTEITGENGLVVQREVAKTFEPNTCEPVIIQKWKSRRKVNHSDSTAAFRMILPPPNVTGKLHLGHALTIAIQDTIARWSSMCGSNVEWIPGFDHAGIATQSVVMRKLKSSSSFSTHLDPLTLRKEMETFANFNSTSIAQQIEAIGGLLDWNSSYYTLDSTHSEVVREAFISLYDLGLIRRGDGIVNWSCALGSSISDIEVHQANFERKTSFRIPGYDHFIDFGVLYFIEYLIEGSGEKIVVATSRPETMFGDVALAVNPSDPRYTSFIGQRAKSPLNGNQLPIIADERVKPDFGSGVLKITPAHDKLDFSVGTDHKLEAICIMDEKGVLNDNCGEYKGSNRFTARQKVIDNLSNSNVVVEVKDYKGSIGLCSRTGDVIEPRILSHWFFQTENLTQKFLRMVDSKEIVIIPDNHLQSLKSQLKVVEDWCLSRQISWGHPIPAYFHSSAPQKWVVAQDITGAKKQIEEELNITVNDLSEIFQDKDVLDTWFSSALIPLALSGWPDNEKVKEISLMETGWDILLFWVWRMVIITLGLTQQLPFRRVLLHGIVTDHYGRKMAKSRGNVIDPMDVVKGASYERMRADALQSFENGELDQNEFSLRVASLEKDYPTGFSTCGSDALRYSLLLQNLCNQEIKLDIQHLNSSKHFTNKLWQAMKFYLRYVEDGINHPTELAKPVVISCLSDQWILSCLYSYGTVATKSLDCVHLHTYAEATRTFLHHQLCDVYIELIKPEMREGLNAEQHVLVLRYILGNGMKLAHPLMPFVTEEIWSHVSQDKSGLLIDQAFPSVKELEPFYNPNLEKTMQNVMKIVKEIRAVKSKVKCKETTYYIEIPTAESKTHDYERFVSSMEILVKGKVKLEAPPKKMKPKYAMYTFVVDNKTCRISTIRTAEIAKLDPVADLRIAKLKIKLNRLNQQIQNPKFHLNAPPEAIEKLKRQVELIKIQLDETNHTSNNKF